MDPSERLTEKNTLKVSFKLLLIRLWFRAKWIWGLKNRSIIQECYSPSSEAEDTESSESEILLRNGGTDR